MKRRVIAIAILVLLSACIAPPAAPETHISFAWTYRAGDYVRGAAAVHDGIVYVGADDNALHALDAANGERLWQVETADNVTSTPVIHQGTLFFGSWDGGVYALDAATGIQRWRYQTSGWVTGPLLLQTRGGSNVLYIGSHDGFLYALRAEDGERMWWFQTSGRIQGGVTLVDDQVVFGSTDNYLYALDAESGALRWRYRAAGDIVSTPAVSVAENIVYVGSLDRTLYALDATTGQARWTYRAEYALESSPLVADDTVYIGSDDGRIYAIRAEDGRLLWQFETQSTVRCTPVAWAHLLFAGSDDGHVYALDRQTGALAWKYRTGDGVAATPTVAESMLFVGSMDRRLHAFHLERPVQGRASRRPDMLWDRETLNSRRRRRRQWTLLLLFALLAAAALFYLFRGQPLSTHALYDRAQQASPDRAKALYERLANELPQIDEYAQLWAAKQAMPSLDALRTLKAVIAYRPQSPAAYVAHLALARHYTAIEAPGAEDAYRAALALEDTAALRLELAQYLEESGDDEHAFSEYRRLLRDRPDAFTGMRRTGTDPLVVAEKLIDATWYSDALEHLREIKDSEAIPLRARALGGIGQHLRAATAYRASLDKAPDDQDTQIGLARTLARLGQTQDALALYQKVDNADSLLAQAELLENRNPDRALALYLDSPYPVAWWSATKMLETQGRLTETLPLYARLGQSHTYFADDAAYRFYVLAERIGDDEDRAQSKDILASLGLNWLALRADGGKLSLYPAPALAPTAEDILEKAAALASLGRDDLARLELVMAARFSDTPEVDLTVAQALAARGDVIDAQEIAQEYTESDSRAPLAFWQLSYPRPYSDTVRAAADEFDVDPLLIWSIMREESRYDPEALSWAGARGLMQIMPATQDWIAEELGQDTAPGDIYIPQYNIHLAAWYLDFLTTYFDGDIELVIAAYNGGAGSVDGWLDSPMVSNRDDLLRWIGYGETREYLSRVSLSYLVYQELYATPDDGGL